VSLETFRNTGHALIGIATQQSPSPATVWHQILSAEDESAYVAPGERIDPDYDIENRVAYNLATMGHADWKCAKSVSLIINVIVDHRARTNDGTIFLSVDRAAAPHLLRFHSWSISNMLEKRIWEAFGQKSFFYGTRDEVLSLRKVPVRHDHY
jgi:hypothetical protein